jgi:CO/xanthine dehydrogenase FAD-binding subunit
MTTFQKGTDSFHPTILIRFIDCQPLAWCAGGTAGHYRRWMDLNTVEAVRTPVRRDELWPLLPGDAVLAGGTWLFSEPQTHLRRLVDITGLGWRSIDVGGDGIELAATCTIAEASALAGRLTVERPDWPGASLLHECATALLASPKIWHTATVGGNICLSLPAGAMISMATALDGDLTVWRADGSDYRVPVAQFVTGAAANILQSAEVVRAIHLPAAALRARTAMRKVAPSPLGRSGVVVVGRRDTAADGASWVLSVTAATVRPFVFRFPAPPAAAAVAEVLDTVPDGAWTDDPHGDPDWRRAMTLLLAEQIRRELS